MVKSPRRASPDKLINVLDKTILYSFHLMVFLLPLALFPFAYDPFDLAKLVIVRLFTFVALVAWILKSYFSGKVVVKRSLLDLPVLVFLGIAVLSTLGSVHFITSLGGKYERYEGLLTLLNYVVLFFLVNQVFSEEKTIHQLVDTLIAASLLVALYGIAQYFGLDPVGWGEQSFETGRVFSTFGNPILLAGFAAMMLPLVLVRFWQEERWLKSIYFGTTILALSISLVLTFSRGGWLAFFTSLAVLILLAGRKTVLSKRTLLLVLLIFILMLAYLLFVPSFQKGVSRSIVSSVLSRAYSIAEVREGSMATRLLIWHSALNMVRSRPLLGSGPDTFHLTYPSFGTLRYAQLVGRWNQPDNAHNYLLQLATTGGLLGMGAFLAIIFSYSWSTIAFVLRGDRKERLLATGITASVIGYFVHLLFSINVIDSGAIFWVLIGLYTPLIGVLYEVRRKYVAVAFGLILVIVAGVSLGWATSSLVADSYFLEAQKDSSFGLLGEAKRGYEQAVKLNPYENLYLLSLANLYDVMGVQAGDENLPKKSRELFRKAQEKNPLELDNYVFLGEFFLRAAASDPRNYSLAETELMEAVRISPHWADTHALLGRLYFETGRFRRAELHFKKVALIDPRDAQAFLGLAQVYVREGRLEDAYRAYTSALSIDSGNVEAKRGLESIASAAGGVAEHL